MKRQTAFPDIRLLDPEKVVVRYGEPLDTLFAHVYGAGVPGVSAQIDDHPITRFDEFEQRVVGLQIEASLTGATVRNPALLALAQFAEIPPSAARNWMKRKDTRSARLGFDRSRVAGVGKRTGPERAGMS